MTRDVTCNSSSEPSFCDMAEGAVVGLNDEHDDIPKLVDQRSSLEQSDLQKISDQFREKEGLTIVVSGLTGAGKSTLIGSLLPATLKQVQTRRTRTEHINVLEKYEGTIRDVFVTVYDTRGFCPLGQADNDAARLHEELKKIFGDESQRHIDLFIYCQAMSSQFHFTSLIALQAFGSLLTKSGWERCIVALTRANFPRLIMLPSEIKEEMQKRYFSQRGLLEISNKIPFVPVGRVTEDVDERATPGSSDSIQDLIDQCILHCKPHSAPALVTALSKGSYETMVSKWVYALVTAGAVAFVTASGAAFGALVCFVFGSFEGMPGVLEGAANGAAVALCGYGVGRIPDAWIRKLWNGQGTES